jgi:hypothetical protein
MRCREVDDRGDSRRRGETFHRWRRDTVEAEAPVSKLANAGRAVGTEVKETVYLAVGAAGYEFGVGGREDGERRVACAPGGLLLAR